MELLRSSILGAEFVNYRKCTHTFDRTRFSDGVRLPGKGNVPVVVDSVKRDLSGALSGKRGKYGAEYVVFSDEPLSEVLRQVRITLIENNREDLAKNIVLGLEDGTLPSMSRDVGSIYKAHRNKEDKILYLIVTEQQSAYEYIMSIVRYLQEAVTGWFKVSG